MPTLDPVVEDQIAQHLVETLRENANEDRWQNVRTGDATTDGAFAGGALRVQSTSDSTVTLYTVKTGEPRQILKTQLKAALGKRDELGDRVFSLQKTIEYKKGSTLCWLHPDHPDRATWDSIGLRGFICQSAHLATDFDADLHMQGRHRREYRAIKAYRETQERETDRALMRALVQKQSGEQTAATIYYCTAEGCSRFFDSEQGRKQHASLSHKEE